MEARALRIVKAPLQPGIAIEARAAGQVHRRLDRRQHRARGQRAGAHDAVGGDRARRLPRCRRARCIDTLPDNESGWLAALRDRYVGRALSRMHARPAYPWTVDELAGNVGLSRSALAQRFTDLQGQPPMQ